jgi:hypothetical protein
MKSRFAATLAVIAVCGCGSASEPAKPPPAVPPIARAAESRSDVAAMLTAVMTAEVCDQLRGRFLPIAHVRQGEVAVGGEPVGGRWWVRDCRTRTYQDQLALYLDGVGWAWGEGTKGVGAKFSVHDYVYFAAAETTLGFVDASFDPSRQLGWVQFRPTSVPYLTSSVTNTVTAHGNLLGNVASFASFGLLGDYADQKAQESAQQIVAQSFAKQIGAGFILMFDVAHRQRDVVTAGQAAPLRPFADGLRWLVNERQVLHARPGALHINGPFAPTQSAGVDFLVTSGELRYRAECERDVLTWLEPAMRGLPPSLPPLAHAQGGSVTPGAATHRTLAASCPWYLVTQPSSDDVVADVRVRADTSAYPAAGP